MRKMVLFLSALATAVSAAADSKLVAGTILVDSDLAAPVVQFRPTADEARGWHLGVNGWVIELGLVSRPDLDRERFIVIELTPLNSHNSDHIYDRGDRAPELEYSGRTVSIRTGTRIERTDSWTSQYAIRALYEAVEDLDDPRIEEFWDKPFIGFDWSESFRLVTGEAPLTGETVGLEVSTRVEGFAGDETWGRFALSQSYGAYVGRWRLGQRMAVLGGHALNRVNAHLVGGSWDVLADRALFGYRYGEFRIRNGIVANASVNFMISESVEVGVRLSALDGSGHEAQGAAFVLGVDWRGTRFRLGAGKPRNDEALSEDLNLFLTVSMARFVD